MTRARVMLAPSLVDGTPNSMFEAMASGALPIVSPLETIRDEVKRGLVVDRAKRSEADVSVGEDM